MPPQEATGPGDTPEAGAASDLGQRRAPTQGVPPECLPLRGWLPVAATTIGLGSWLRGYEVPLSLTYLG